MANSTMIEGGGGGGAPGIPGNEACAANGTNGGSTTSAAPQCYMSLRNPSGGNGRRLDTLSTQFYMRPR